MCNFLKSNGEQCKLSPKKERCGKHPININQEIIVVERNIVEDMPPQVNTPVIAEVVDMPAPSVIKPVEDSNVELSKVPEMNESIVIPVISDDTVYGEDYSSDLKLNNYAFDDEYDSDASDDFIPAKPIGMAESTQVVKANVSEDSWMYEQSDDSNSDDSSDEDNIVWSILAKEEEEYNSDDDLESGIYRSKSLKL
ncbi:hypothetical protein GQ600_12149 [Phytophthora cactorum]|nr:hypothetical protein GQ600_12149 [Phytophthora cactorum]